jgi:5-methylcytosine-specific restriction endonuclease McrA
MPVERWRLCAEPYCAELVLKPARFCAEHAKGWERWRRSPNGAAHQDGYSSARWRRLRAERMRFAGGICEDCHRRPAVAVHHVDHATADSPTFFVFANLLALCDECHRRRSHELERGVRFADRRLWPLSAEHSPLRQWMCLLPR